MSGASAQAKEIEAQNVKLRQQLLEMANTNQDLLRRLKSFQRDATDDEREEMVKGLQKQVHAMQSTLNEALERSRNAEKEAREEAAEEEATCVVNHTGDHQGEETADEEERKAVITRGIGGPTKKERRNIRLRVAHTAAGADIA